MNTNLEMLLINLADTIDDVSRDLSAFPATVSA